MQIFDAFFFLFSISFVCHAWNMKELQIFTLLWKKTNSFISGNIIIWKRLIRTQLLQCKSWKKPKHIHTFRDTNEQFHIWAHYNTETSETNSHTYGRTHPHTLSSTATLMLAPGGQYLHYSKWPPMASLLPHLLDDAILLLYMQLNGN